VSSYLKELAEKAKASGYPEGSAWQALLDAHIKEHYPAFREMMGEEYQDYLVVQTNDAIDLMTLLIQQGVATPMAKLLAKRELLNVDLEETSPPETTDTEITSS